MFIFCLQTVALSQYINDDDDDVDEEENGEENFFLYENNNTNNIQNRNKMIRNGR